MFLVTNIDKSPYIYPYRCDWWKHSYESLEISMWNGKDEENHKHLSFLKIRNI
jgi:hypothetical protein